MFGALHTYLCIHVPDGVPDSFACSLSLRRILSNNSDGTVTLHIPHGGVSGLIQDERQTGCRVYRYSKSASLYP